MTTDTAEKTELSELTQEAPPDSQGQEPEIPSDAGQSPTADAASASDTSSTEESQEEIPDSPEAYVASVLEKESGETAPEAEQQRPRVDPEEVARKVQAYRGTLQSKHNAIDAHAQKLRDAGYDAFQVEAITKTAHDSLNELHAASLTDGHYEAAVNAQDIAAQALFKGANEEFAPDEWKAYNAALDEVGKSSGGKPSFADAMRAAIKTARDAGSKAGYKDGLKRGFTDGRASGEKAASRGSSGQSVEGNAGGGPRNPDDVLSDPSSSPDARAKAFEDKYGFKPS